MLISVNDLGKKEQTGKIWDDGPASSSPHPDKILENDRGDDASSRADDESFPTRDDGMNFRDILILYSPQNFFASSMTILLTKWRHPWRHPRHRDDARIMRPSSQKIGPKHFCGTRQKISATYPHFLICS